MCQKSLKNLSSIITIKKIHLLSLPQKNPSFIITTKKILLLSLPQKKSFFYHYHKKKSFFYHNHSNPHIHFQIVTLDNKDYQPSASHQFHNVLVIPWGRFGLRKDQVPYFSCVQMLIVYLVNMTLPVMYEKFCYSDQ